MRKFFAFLVLLILPLQISFAAAAEYCEIERNDSGRHFGHHSHDGAKDQKESSPKQGKADKDCAFCQLGCSHAQVSGMASLAFSTHQSPVQGVFPLPDGESPPGFDRPPKHELA